jgi:cell division protein FtsQ
MTATTTSVGRARVRRGGAQRPGARRVAPQRVGPQRVGWIDPRMRARRVAVRRARGQARLHRLLSALGLVAALGCVVGVALSPVLDVNRVLVRGVARGQVGEVRAVADVAVGDPTVLVGTGGIETRVEALSWVADARARRDFPGTVRIVVTPRVAASWVARPDGTAAVVDRTGVVIASLPAAPPGVPRLDGVTRVPDPGGRVAPRGGAVLAGTLPEALRTVTGAVVVVGGDVTATLTTGPQLRFGAATRLGDKARAAHAVLGAIGGAPVGYVDVRVPSAPVTG